MLVKVCANVSEGLETSTVLMWTLSGWMRWTVSDNDAADKTGVGH